MRKLTDSLLAIACTTSIALAAIVALPGSAEGQIFPRLFNRNCCPPQPCCWVQPATTWNGQFSTGYAYNDFANYNWQFPTVVNDATATVFPGGQYEYSMAGVPGCGNQMMAVDAFAPGNPQYGPISSSEQQSTVTRNDGPQYIQSPSENSNSTSDSSNQDNGSDDEQNSSAHNTEHRSHTAHNSTNQQRWNDEGSKIVADTEINESSWSQSNSQVERQLQHLIASKMYLGNQCAIELAKLADSRSNSDEVKQFATDLIEHHSELGKQLKQYAPVVVTNESSSVQIDQEFAGVESDDSKHANEGTDNVSENETAENRVTVGRVNYETTVSPLVEQVARMERAAFNNALQSIKQELSDVSATEFDKHFVQLQCLKHTEMLACLKAVDSQGIGEMQDLVEEAIRRCEEHLNRAKELKSSLAADQTD